MIQSLLVAVAMLAALPAAAQSERLVPDTADQGDWWWVDVTGGRGPDRAMLLLDGEGVRRGDVVELRASMIYREPDRQGSIGSRIDSSIDCKNMIETATFIADFYPDLKVLITTPVTREKALTERSIYYRFACLGDRSDATHYGAGSRRDLAERIFKQYPRP